MCRLERKDYFSSRQLAYFMLLKGFIHGSLLPSEEISVAVWQTTHKASELIALYQFKQRYEANNYFLS